MPRTLSLVCPCTAVSRLSVAVVACRLSSRLEVLMNSIQTAVSVRRTLLLAPFIAALSLSVLTGCGKSGGDDDSKKSKPKNSWDEMRWDDGEWGAVETRPHRISIA